MWAPFREVRNVSELERGAEGRVTEPRKRQALKKFGGAPSAVLGPLA